MTTKAYDAAKLSVVLGSIPIHGFAEDRMFEIDFEDDLYKETFDNRGEVYLSKISRNTATLTLCLLQSSPSNNVLSSFVEANRVNDSGMCPIIIKDNNSTTIFACATAYVKQVPKVSYSSDKGVREWVIRATNVSKFI